MIKVILLIALLLILGFGAYVRLAPASPGDWHKMPEPEGPENEILNGGFIHREDLAPGTGPGTLARLDQIIRATPRTRVLAGSVDEGMITYETRSLLWGFPDYTTVALSGPAQERLLIRGHLRFGKSDLGVNKKRITGWLEELKREQ